jgi:hypothetical protein
VSAPSNPEHIDRGASRRSPNAEFGKANTGFVADGLNEPIAPIQVPVPSSAKSVMFDLNPQEKEISPERTRDDDDDDDDRDGRGRHHYSSNDRHRHRDDSPDSVSSSSTIELPPRFDELGRQRELDPLAKGLESVLVGLFSR